MYTAVLKLRNTPPPAFGLIYVGAIANIDDIFLWLPCMHDGAGALGYVSECAMIYVQTAAPVAEFIDL